MPGSRMSAAKRARPVTLSSPSGRIGRVPMNLRTLAGSGAFAEGAAFAGCASAGAFLGTSGLAAMAFAAGDLADFAEVFAAFATAGAFFADFAATLAGVFFAAGFLLA